MGIIKELPNQIVLSNGIKLELCNRKCRGQGNLKDIEWYKYKIVNNNEKDIIYDNICLSMFRITEDIREEASKNIVDGGVSFPSVERPHVDCNTGNIHPPKEFVIENRNKGVLQLVLCKGQGPNTTDLDINENIYIYKNRSTQREARIHKACYYPLIQNDGSLENDWRYKFLSEVWERLN